MTKAKYDPTLQFRLIFFAFSWTKARKHIRSIVSLFRFIRNSLRFNERPPLKQYTDLIWVHNRNNHCLTSEFHVEFHAKTWYRTNREAISAILVFEFFLSRIAKATWADLNVYCFCEPHQCANNGNHFNVNDNSFSRSFECEWLSVRFKIWQTFFSLNFALFQGDCFLSTSCIFSFTIATIFCSRVTSAIILHTQVQFYVKYTFSSPLSHQAAI